MRRRAPTISRSTVQSLLRERPVDGNQIPPAAGDKPAGSIKYQVLPSKKRTIQVAISYPPEVAAYSWIRVVSLSPNQAKFAVLLHLCTMLPPPKQEIIAQLSLVSNFNSFPNEQMCFESCWSYRSLLLPRNNWLVRGAGEEEERLFMLEYWDQNT